jgi:hypothetical protein
MDRSQFWALLDQARADADGTHEERLRRRLGNLSPADLVDFDRHTLQLLVRSEGLGMRAAAHLVGCSDDGFRGWLLAQGRAVFEAALADPDALAGVPALGPELPEMWTMARDAYLSQVGTEMPDLGTPTLDDDEDDAFDPEDDAELAKRFPRLFARFRSGG